MNMGAFRTAALAAAMAATGVSFAGENDVLYWKLVDSESDIRLADGTTQKVSAYTTAIGKGEGESFAVRVRVTGGGISGNVFLGMCYEDGAEEPGRFGIDIETSGSGHTGAGVPVGSPSPTGSYAGCNFVMELGKVAYDSVNGTNTWTTLASSEKKTYEQLSDYIHAKFDLNPPSDAAWAPPLFDRLAAPLNQRSTGENRELSIPLTDELMDELGFVPGEDGFSSAALSNCFNQVDANGLRRWENLATGTETNQLVFSMTQGDGGDRSLSILVSDPEGAVTNRLGYTVLHELQYTTNGVWSRAAGPSAEDAFSVTLLDGSGASAHASGYYRVATLLVPNDDLSITNAIPSTNIVGVLEIASAATNTMTAVPFTALVHDPATTSNVTVEAYVLGGFLAAGDQLRVSASSSPNGVYRQWNRRSAPEDGSMFDALDSVGDVTIHATNANAFALARGNAVWVTRGNPTSPFFIVGQYSGEPVTVTIAGGDPEASGKAAYGCTMVANPNIAPLAINSISWGANPGANDTISIPSGTGRLDLQWKNGSWGRLKKSGKKQTWYTGDTVAPGMGFWYYRKASGDFTISIAAGGLAAE